MTSKPRWEPGLNGIDTPFDYGWYRATRDEPFTPDVRFETEDDFEEYKQGYNEAKRPFEF